MGLRQEQAGRELAPSGPNSDQGEGDLQKNNQFFSLEIKSFWHHLLLILLQCHEFLSRPKEHNPDSNRGLIAINPVN